MTFIRQLEHTCFVYSCVVTQTSLLFDIATLAVAELRRTFMVLAEALSDPGRRFTPDQVLLKGHELNHGKYGTRSSPPETRSQYVDVS